MDINEQHSAQWLEKVSKPFEPLNRMTQKVTDEARAADALEYIAHQLWSINQKLSALPGASDSKPV